MYTGLITVRIKSSRLPVKCLLKFGSATVLEYVILRCKFFNIDPIVCTTNNKDDDLIVDICKGLNVKYFRGSSINKLKRWNDCCEKFNLDFFHTIDCDDLYFCPDLVKQSLNILKKRKDLNIILPTNDSSNFASGLVGYSFSSIGINKIIKNIKINTDTEMIEPFLLSNKFLRKYKLRNPKEFNYKVRMTLDYLEDYIFFCKLRKNLSEYPSRKEIYKYLSRNKDIIKINNKLNIHWKNNQSRIKRSIKIL